MIGGGEGEAGKMGKRTRELRYGPLTDIRDYRKWNGKQLRSLEASSLGIPLSTTCSYRFVITNEQMRQFKDPEYPLGDIPEPMHEYIQTEEDGTRGLDESVFFVVRDMGEDW